MVSLVTLALLTTGRQEQVKVLNERVVYNRNFGN